MKKPYEAHEAAYRRMRQRGLNTWEQLNTGRKNAAAIHPEAKRFLAEVLRQPWVAGKGKVIEFGCGTGPMLRWLAGRGFGGVGIEISKTAVSMARAQSKGTGLRFRQADVCGDCGERPGTFDLVVDGHCLHCVTHAADRWRFLANARRLLKPDGVLAVSTMCGPVDRRAWRAKFPMYKLIEGAVYFAMADAERYSDSRKLGERRCTPIRYIGHWKGILAEIKRAGFEARLIRYSGPYEGCPNGTLSVVATVSE